MAAHPVMAIVQFVQLLQFVHYVRFGLQSCILGAFNFNFELFPLRLALIVWPCPVLSGFVALFPYFEAIQICVRTATN